MEVAFFHSPETGKRGRPSKLWVDKDGRHLPADIQKKMNAMYPMAVHGDAHPIEDNDTPVVGIDLKDPDQAARQVAMSVAEIARIRDDPRAPPSVRLAAAKEIREIVEGKTVARTEISGHIIHSRDVQRELMALMTDDQLERARGIIDLSPDSVLELPNG